MLIGLSFFLFCLGAGYWLFGQKNAKENRETVLKTVNPSSYYEFCSPIHIVDDIEGLKTDLQKRLFGQHIVNATLIPALRSHINNIEESEKPLVMSFHGTIGTGKNHVTDLIIKHFYKYGEDSKFVHRYRARKDFPVISEVEIYRVSELNQFLIFFFKQIMSMEVF